MKQLNWQLVVELETAYEDGGGEYQWWCEGHFYEAFLKAVEFKLADEKGMRVQEWEHLTKNVHRTWWVNIFQTYDADGNPENEWMDESMTVMFEEAKPSAIGAYPVTYIEIADAENASVPVCMPCSDNAHDYCSLFADSLDVKMRAVKNRYTKLASGEMKKHKWFWTSHGSEWY